MVVPSSFPALSHALVSPDTSFPFSPPSEGPHPLWPWLRESLGPKEEC
jgi:hypothetical protein